MKKKTVAAMLTICMVLGMTACAGGKKEEKTTIDGRKARQYNVKRVNQEMYPSG